jgi:hypothetical protein
VWLLDIVHVNFVVLVRGVSQRGLLSIDHYHIALRFAPLPGHCCPDTPVVSRHHTV